MHHLIAQVDPQSIDLAGLPVKWVVAGHLAMTVLKWLGEFYSSVRAGGGLKRIFMAFIYGEQLPKVVAEDYKKELSTPPFPPKDPPAA